MLCKWLLCYMKLYCINDYMLHKIIIIIILLLMILKLLCYMKIL
jgi:hypothetical protein